MPRPRRTGNGRGGGAAIVLRPHQRHTVKAILAGAQGSERGTLVSACGTGKTITSAEVSRRIAPTEGVACFVPTVDLLAQTIQQWATYLGRAAGRIVAVCSAREVHHPGWAAVKDLTGIDVLVTTDPARLAAERGGRVSVVCTYASLPVIQAAHARHGAPAWRLLLVDEAHRTAGREGKPWAAVHDNLAVPAARRLYMTATPRIVTSRGPTISMDDVTVYGPVLHRLTFAQAIDQRLLADYRMVVGVVTDAELAALTESAVFTVDGRAVPGRMLGAQIALGRAIGEYRLRRVITYHTLIAAATRFATTLPAALSLLPAAERGDRPVAAWPVSGRSTAKHRKHVLSQLRDPGDHTAVATNARVYSEGIDVPALDAVMIVDPRASVVDAVQIVGRALRLGDDPEKIATVLVPVLATVADLAAHRIDRAWEAVWQLVRALRAHDERIDTQLDHATTPTRHTRGTQPRRRTVPWLEVTGAPIPAGFADKVQLRVAKTLHRRSWQETYEAAAAFYAQDGHLRPDPGYRTASGYLLGVWIRDQCRRHQHGLLTPAQVALLEQIGMIWDPEEADWQARLTEMRAWCAAHGTAKPPPRPYTWLTKQRTLHQRGLLPSARVRALQSLGIDLTPRVTTWQRFLDHAQRYRQEHGHLHVPHGYRAPDGYPLGAKIAILRHHRRRGRVPQDRIATLDALGMIWDTDHHRWTEFLAEASAYHAEHGHLRVPRSYLSPSGHKLGISIATVCAQHAAGCLAFDRVNTLEKLGIVWYGTRSPSQPTPPSPPAAPRVPAALFRAPST